MPNHTTIDIPPDIPPPKFKLFQLVYYGKRQGVVTAMRYHCAIEALIENLPRCGWEYGVSYVFGKTPKQAIGVDATATEVPETSLRDRPPQPPEVAAS